MVSYAAAIWTIDRWAAARRVHPTTAPTTPAAHRAQRRTRTPNAGAPRDSPRIRWVEFAARVFCTAGDGPPRHSKVATWPGRFRPAAFARLARYWTAARAAGRSS